MICFFGPEKKLHTQKPKTKTSFCLSLTLNCIFVFMSLHFDSCLFRCETADNSSGVNRRTFPSHRRLRVSYTPEALDGGNVQIIQVAYRQKTRRRRNPEVTLVCWCGAVPSSETVAHFIIKQIKNTVFRGVCSLNQ